MAVLRPLSVAAAVHLLAAILPLSVLAQPYPSGIVRIVVPFPPGGGADRLARLLADKLRVRWNQPVIVENRAGAGGNIGAEFVARATGDGHTLLYGFPQQYVLSKMLYKKLAYDPDAFVPVSLLTSAPNMLVAHPGVKADTLQQLIAFARSNPGRLNYSTTGLASTQHLTGELFNKLAGVKTVHVPFNGTGPALTAVLGGQVELMIVEVNNVIPHIRAGKLRALAVGSERSSPVLPDVPTFSAVLPGLVATAWSGLAATPGTPGAVAGALSSAVVEAMQQPEITRFLGDAYLDNIGGTPAEMALLIRQEKARWGEVVKSLNMTMD